jgi:hypothetical protein
MGILDFLDSDDVFLFSFSQRDKVEEVKRVVSKNWFIQLLKKLKKYNKRYFSLCILLLSKSLCFVSFSSSVSRLPLSLFLLLATLKKLIGLNIVISKEIVWSLVEKTIQPEEYRSNLVHSILTNLYDAVHITSEEIYQRLKQRKIEIAPKFLMQVRKEMKAKQLQQKIANAEKERETRRKFTKRFKSETNQASRNKVTDEVANDREFDIAGLRERLNESAEEDNDEFDEDENELDQEDFQINEKEFDDLDLEKYFDNDI